MAKAQKGDLIRIVRHSGIGSYKIGDIFEVRERHETDTRTEPGVYVKGQMPFIFDWEYEIHRKAGEEDAPKQTRDGFRELQLQVVEGKTPEEAVAISMAELRAEQDAVNSPNHYTQGRFETIEIIEEITQGYSDGYVAYCVGNALKYLARAPFKHGEPTEDIGKAAKYIEFALARLQTQK